jgi:ribosomal protein L13E
MARQFRCGPGSPYGCAHHDEHVAAAKLGWARRRASGTFMLSDRDSHALSRAVGEVKGAHIHPSHKHVVAFKQKGKWYELPASEFRALIRAGHEDLKLDKQEQKRRAAEEKAIAEYYAAVALEEKREAKRAELATRQQERERDRQERLVRQVQRAERAEVVKIIKGGGGITYGVSKATGKTYDHGEWLTLPADVRRKNGRLTLDGAAEQINAEMPWLGIETPNDLLDYFDKIDNTRRNQEHQRNVRKGRAA